MELIQEHMTGFLLLTLFVSGSISGVVTRWVLQRRQLRKTMASLAVGQRFGSSHPLSAWIVKTGRCPVCQNGHLMKGPSGGMCVNLICDHCSSRINFMPFGIEMIHVFHPPEKNA